MIIKIKSICGSPLFEGDFSGIKEALVVALKSGADLRGADLRGADLLGANLRGADLRGADLLGADLRGADLCGANLRGADLRGADLLGADLRGADLRGADLCDADLCDADLCDANLRGADLCDADLRGADLRRADLCDADLRDAKNAGPALALTVMLPEGDLVGWKKCEDGVLVKLKIPSAAKRSSANGRKCRAEFAEVMEVIGSEVGISMHNPATIYRVGETVKAHEWCEDRWQECAGGIHFYITRAEAENH